MEVFDRPETFDPTVDPLVRIEAARLRDKLREYYEADGQSDPIRIDLPKGSYTPQIEFQGCRAKSGNRGQDPRSLKPILALPAAQPRPLGDSRWRQMALPILALILVLGALGAWLTRDLWAA